MMHENLRDMIRDMQMNDCKDAKDEIKYLSNMMRELLRSGSITPADEKELLAMLQHFCYVQTIFEAFIPPKQ